MAAAGLALTTPSFFGVDSLARSYPAHDWGHRPRRNLAKSQPSKAAKKAKRKAAQKSKRINRNK